MIVLLTLLVSLLESPVRAEEPANVIFITWDGVRYEEMFEGEDAQLGGKAGTEIFPRMKARLESAPKGSAALLGDRVASEAKISNPVAISLPAYQSLMAGKTTGCLTNSCDRIEHETLPEAYLRLTGQPREKAAVFGSWVKIELAAERKEGSLTVNTGVTTPEEASDLPPWGDARFDRQTWSQAMAYRRERRPGFMFISLNDSDEWAHRNRYPEYLEILRQYDAWLEELLVELESSPEGRNTIVLVTTDHGRGKGSQWTDHGASIANARWVWAYAEDLSGRGRVASLAKSRRVEHADLRGIMERWLGIAKLPLGELRLPLDSVSSQP